MRTVGPLVASMAYRGAKFNNKIHGFYLTLTISPEPSFAWVSIDDRSKY